jgi:hypothetical protein
VLAAECRRRSRGRNEIISPHNIVIGAPNRCSVSDTRSGSMPVRIAVIRIIPSVCTLLVDSWTSEDTKRSAIVLQQLLHSPG